MTIPKEILAVWLGSFLLTAAASLLGLQVLQRGRRQKLAQALRDAPGAEEDGAAILSEQVHMAAEKARRVPSRAMNAIERRIRESGERMTAGTFLLLTAVLAAAGALVCAQLRAPAFRKPAMLAGAAVLGSLPHLWLTARRNSRLNAFEKQFPDALDFLARSMRAGHGFSVALEMLSEEFPPPLSLEFRRIYHEQNLGAPIEVALKDFAARMPLLDVKFFVSSVSLQRETGGNLAEIITKLSSIIRERFKLRGHVKAVSAHGRITAAVLTALPVLTLVGLLIRAPGYLEALAADSTGRYMMMVAATALAVAYLVIRNIVRIKV